MIYFYKYQGTGNDFILIDNRSGELNLSKQQIAALCDRRFGIGADGLMLLQQAQGYDFRMVYYNSDGDESTMCGNGGRCIAAFAQRLGIVDGMAHFVAIDGVHEAVISDDGTVRLGMIDVAVVHFYDRHTLLNTGSPHYVLWVDDVLAVDVRQDGKSIRYDAAYQPGGVNVNFAQKTGNGIKVRTYERGVEDETLSCGTGVTAAAIAATGYETGSFVIQVATPGGELTVSFSKDTPVSAKEVALTGPAVFVFSGTINM